MNANPNTTQLARAAIEARDRYGWSPEADEALNALRAALTTQPAMELPRDIEQEIFNDWLDAACLHVNNIGDICGEPTDDDVRQLMRVVWDRARASASSAAVGERPAGFLWRSKGSSEPWKFCRDASQADDPDVFERTDIRFVYEGPRPTPPSAQQEGGA